jgi:hypothetical protein
MVAAHADMEVQMRRMILTGLVAIVSFSTTAVADDASASFLTRLFINVCIPNVGQAENIRAWALEKKLVEVTTPSALEVFVGAGNGGAAWAVPASFGSFALSIRGKTQACAVYARAAEPVEVESNFKKILEGVARPGLVVKIVKNTEAPGPTGMIHTLIYSVSSVGNEGRGYLYTLQTAERSGGAFQDTLQAAKYDSAL